MSEPDDLIQQTVTRFNQLYYEFRNQTWKNTRYRGVTLYKYPTDLWIYQEIVHETKPTVVVETGTAHGGAALYLAELGVRVVTVDINRLPEFPRHDAITYVTGSSVDPAIVEQVRSHLRPDERVMVILDSDHAQSHVAAELAVYPQLVTPGCYLIVEDTNVNGHPVFAEHGPGPLEALSDWAPKQSDFECDRSREKHMLTANPLGYWRRRH